MAKKSKLKELVNKKIQSGYNNGFWQSLIIHELVIILLALVIIEIPKKADPILLSFSINNAEEFSIDQSPILSLDFEETKFSEDLPADNQEIVLEETSLDVPNIEDIAAESVAVSNPNNLSLDDIDLTQEIVQESAVQTLAETADRESTSNQNSTTRSRFMQMLSDGSSLSDGIPAEALVAGSGVSSSVANAIVSRLQMYGAKTGDIQVSLIWNTADDIDLHVQYSDGFQSETICWRQRYGRSNGMLDIDMNAVGPMSNTPVENIFWPLNMSPRGQYTIGIHFFRSWTGNTAVPVIIRIQTLKGVNFVNAVARLNQPVTIISSFSN